MCCVGPIAPIARQEPQPQRHVPHQHHVSARSHWLLRHFSLRSLLRCLQTPRRDQCARQLVWGCMPAVCLRYDMHPQPVEVLRGHNNTPSGLQTQLVLLLLDIGGSRLAIVLDIVFSLPQCMTHDCSMGNITTVQGKPPPPGGTKSAITTVTCGLKATTLYRKALTATPPTVADSANCLSCWAAPPEHPRLVAA